MAIICPSCDQAPAAGAVAGSTCLTCGSPLVRVADEQTLVGTTFNGSLEIVEKLGEGGAGVVYRARDLATIRELALKVLDRRFQQDPVATKRFLREATVASKLRHPNIVGIHDFGKSADGQLYIAMELVRGKTLYDDLIDNGPMTRERICAIGAQVCDAVSAAHALSIVHRDLKLENVMLLEGTRDQAKVLDFGLARSTIDPSMKATATGNIAGTPRYLPPEIIQRSEPSPAQDMYAIGVILGELSIGRVLWEAPSLPALFAMKMRGNDDVLAQLPAWVRPLVGALLDKNPLQRPDAVTVRGELRRLEMGAVPSTTFEASGPAVRPSLSELASGGVRFNGGGSGAAFPATPSSSVPLDVVTSPAPSSASAMSPAMSPHSISPAMSPPSTSPAMSPPSTSPAMSLPSISPPSISRTAADAMFAPPPESAPALELDPAWVAEKQALQQRAVDEQRVARRRLVIGTVVGCLLVTGVAVAVGYFAAG